MFADLDLLALPQQPLDFREAVPKVAYSEILSSLRSKAE